MTQRVTQREQARVHLPQSRVNRVPQGVYLEPMRCAFVHHQARLGGF
jgi:hypothetical protein